MKVSNAPTEPSQTYNRHFKLIKFNEDSNYARFPRNSAFADDNDADDKELANEFTNRQAQSDSKSVGAMKRNSGKRKNAASNKKRQLQDDCDASCGVGKLLPLELWPELCSRLHLAAISSVK